MPGVPQKTSTAAATSRPAICSARWWRGHPRADRAEVEPPPLGARAGALEDARQRPAHRDRPARRAGDERPEPDQEADDEHRARRVEHADRERVEDGRCGRSRQPRADDGVQVGAAPDVIADQRQDHGQGEQEAELQHGATAAPRDGDRAGPGGDQQQRQGDGELVEEVDGLLRAGQGLSERNNTNVALPGVSATVSSAWMPLASRVALTLGRPRARDRCSPRRWTCRSGGPCCPAAPP